MIISLAGVCIVSQSPAVIPLPLIGLLIAAAFHATRILDNCFQAAQPAVLRSVHDSGSRCPVIHQGDLPDEAANNAANPADDFFVIGPAMLFDALFWLVHQRHFMATAIRAQAT
jgi:hypothetical protein